MTLEIWKVVELMLIMFDLHSGLVGWELDFKTEGAGLNPEQSDFVSSGEFNL